MLDFDQYPDSSSFNYLSRKEVVRCCADVDLTGVVEETLGRHAAGDTILPDEAYLGWQTPEGDAARSLAMPGAVRQDGDLRLGLKVINASLGNPARGIARSQGLLMLFDQEIAWPHTIMEAAYVSSLRTAAVTAVSVRRLANSPSRTIALLGCGALARAHLILLLRQLPELASVRLYDVEPARAEALAGALREDPDTGALDVVVAGGPQECVEGADIVIPVTNVTEGYLRHEWFAPGALISHVSLDDVLPEVVERSQLLVVDDWQLVSHDDRRLLGRMYRAGTLLGPDGEQAAGVRPDPDARQVDCTLGDIVLGNHPGRKAAEDLVLCNPFGMSILDVAVGSAVARVAAEQNLGQRIPF